MDLTSQGTDIEGNLLNILFWEQMCMCVNHQPIADMRSGHNTTVNFSWPPCPRRQLLVTDYPSRNPEHCFDYPGPDRRVYMNYSTDDQIIDKCLDANHCSNTRDPVSAIPEKTNSSKAGHWHYVQVFTWEFYREWIWLAIDKIWQYVAEENKLPNKQKPQRKTLMDL